MKRVSSYPKKACPVSYDHTRSILRLAIAAFISCRILAFGADDDDLRFNAFGQKSYTLESTHFTISYNQGLEDIAREAGGYFENLYETYSKTYGIVLPSKTTVFIADGELTNGYAFYNLNAIILWPHDFDINLRGSRDWLKGVIAHEYAHVVSITAGSKLPPWLPYIQFGFFSHPNEKNRTELLQLAPSDILPVWLSEGIAQFEDSRNGTDSWDSHRDMILRSLSLSNRLLSPAHMAVFAGKGDDWEKSYSHGFSLVKYIADTYGYDKVVSIVRECAVVYRLDYQSAIKRVLGISMNTLYADWKKNLQDRYNAQLKSLGTQAFGRKINKDGYNNYWPKFSPDEKKIFFLSNGKNEYSSRLLYSYDLSDTLKDDKKIKIEKGIKGFYSIHTPSGLIAFSSMKSRKSTLPADRGGIRLFDAFIDTLPPQKKKFQPFKKKTERQVTEKKSAFAAVFSPSGDKLVLALRTGPDQFTLAISDTNGKNMSLVYPSNLNAASAGTPFKYLYTLDWSSDGRHIAMSYIDSGTRKIGIYDTLSHTFSVMKNSGYDDRDPRYSADGLSLYFSSDRTGIFNIYRYDFDTRYLLRYTNVSGGAFAPDASKRGDKLVFANYDKDGFGIYLIDSVKILERTFQDSMLLDRPRIELKSTFISGSPRPYLHLPNLFTFYPMIVSEQAMTQSGNVFRGQSTLKAGGIVSASDLLSFLGSGTDISAYLLLEPTKIFNFINLDKSFFGRDINYDLGGFGTTRLLPVAVSAEYMQRGITASDSFTDFSAFGRPEMREIKYTATLRDFDLYATHPIGGGLKANILGSYNWYDIYMNTRNLFGVDFPYTLAQGYRLGSFLSLLAPVMDSRTEISPRGLYAKPFYYFWNQQLLSEDKGITFENGYPKENYDSYLYHEAGLRTKFGMSSPWYDKHDIYAEVNFASMVPQGQIMNQIQGKSDSVKNVPSYYKEAVWMPGYAYFYEQKRGKENDQQFIDTLKYDTLLISGNAASVINLSYRFPLWPSTLIDQKLWFIYFSKIYGAINFSAGAGWEHVSDIIKFRKRDWLSSAGLELRLETISFSSIPLDIKFRWDRGFNRPAPIGGDRFTLGIGLSFDYWEYIDMPDYAAPALGRLR
jgi:Tol biopolymer transport system component